MADLKLVYGVSTLEDAEYRLEEFCEKWDKKWTWGRLRSVIKLLFLKITPAKMRICRYKKLKNRTFSLVPDVSIVFFAKY